MESWNNHGKLSLDSLGEVLEELYDVNTKWYTIGLRLQLKTSSLERIKVSCSIDPAECFREMLKQWLQSSEDCSWSVLISALRSKSVGEYSLAKSLEKKSQEFSEKEVYCSVTSEESSASARERPSSIVSDEVFLSLKGKFNRYIELSPSSPTHHCDSSSSDASAISTDVDRNAAYGCGCGKCSLNNFLDGRCPEPEKAATSFPYLKVSALSESEKMILKGRLFDDFCKISMQFSEFNTAICESLIHRNIPVQKVTRILRDLRAFPPSSSNAPLLGSHLDSITPDKTIDDIFDILSHYVSFFNFQITEHIVNNLGTDHDKVLLCIYKKKLDEYCNRNIFECPIYSTSSQEQEPLVLKVEGIEQYSMKHLSMLIAHVSRALSITNNSLRLCSVEEGCVKLNFQVPLCVKDTVFPLNTETINRIMNLGKSMNKPVFVTLIKCGFYIYRIPLLKETKIVAVDRGCIYNHGLLSRPEAESLLSSVDYNCFLVRQSPNAAGCIIYSYKDFGVFNHVKQEGAVDQEFIHKTKRSVCLMPVHIHVSALQNESAIDENASQAAAMSDYGSDSERDLTGESTGDFCGTGDSAIFETALPLLQKPTSSHLKEEKYEKLNPKNLDKHHTYWKVNAKK